MPSFTRFQMIAALCSASAFCSGAHAQVSWERFGDAPVLAPGDPGSWDAGVASGLCVLHDGDGYKGWYTGAQATTSPAQIGLAVSADGIEWEKVGTEPVLPRVPDTWEDAVYHPSVIRDGGGYQMWYGASLGSAGSCQIGHATSSDGVDWVRDGAPALEIENIPWESSCIDNARVVMVDGRYFMYYSGGLLSIESFRSWTIGLAVSEDGIHWTRHGGNPVFKLDAPGNPTGLISTFARYDTAAGAFEIWYNIYHAARDNGVAIGWATSADGIEWCDHPGNPVLSAAEGTWDFGFTGNAAVLFEGGEYRMWYTGGAEGSLYATGHAVSEWSIPRASFSAAPRAATDSLTVDFDASRSATASRSLVSYQWDFGDGSPAMTVSGDPRTSHAYAAPGHYVARLTAADTAGQEGCAARGVEVRRPSPPGIGPFLRGDCNGDGSVSGVVTDVVFMLNFNFLAGPEPPCTAACDANADGAFSGTVTDAVYVLNFNFLGGPAPPEPFPACGRSEFEGDAALGCESPWACP